MPGILLMGLFGSDLALAGFVEETEFVSSPTTSLKVVGVEGTTLTVLIDGVERSDTIPAIFNTDDRDRYVQLTAASPAGETWSKKVEVKAFHQTVVRLQLDAATAPAAPAAATQAYVGWVYNSMDLCAPEQRWSVRFEFAQQGVTKYSWDLLPGYSQQNAAVLGGHYDVRSYWWNGAQWVYHETLPLDVDRDGWKWRWGCDV